MKRNTRVAKPQRGEREPFSRQLHLARKENLRLRDECASRIKELKRKHKMEIDAAHANLNKAIEDRKKAILLMEMYQELHKDFARVAPVLRSKSILRRLWWGVRFGLWVAFGFEVKA